MMIVSCDAVWIARLRKVASRGGGPVVSRASLLDIGPREERSFSLLVLDRSLAGASPARAVSSLRALYPSVVVVLACSEDELAPHAVDAALHSGADETVSKGWDDKRLHARFSDLGDRALRGNVRVSVEGTLKAEGRSQRAFVLRRGRWDDLRLPPVEFALLWRLMANQEEAVSRAELLDALRLALGRELEAGTVSRRVLALRRALSPWKGGVESIRGGRYRLISRRPRA